MVTLPLDVALSVLTLASMLLAVQQILLTVEIYALRRDLKSLMRMTASMNDAINPWCSESADTVPGYKRSRRASYWFPRLGKDKRQPPK